MGNDQKQILYSKDSITMLQIEKCAWTYIIANIKNNSQLIKLFLNVCTMNHYMLI